MLAEAMRDAVVYAADHGSAVEVSRTLADVGFAARHLPFDETVDGDDATSLPPPALAVVVAPQGGPPPAALCARLRHDPHGRVPLVLVLDPEHLRAPAHLPAVDELLVRPFPADELAVRVARARGEAEAGSDVVLRAGPIELDLDAHEALVDGRPVAFTRLEFELLRFLMASPGRVFSREELLTHVWGYRYFGGARTVDVHVRRLRVKLGPHAARVATVRGMGYRLAR